MKQLLSISKERKDKDGKKNMKQIIQSEPVQQQHNFIYQQQQSDIMDMDGPTQQQVRAYAEILGIKLPEQQDLLYLARQCLNQQTPPDWHCEEDEQGQIIYVNHKTGEVSLQHPCDQIFRKKVISQRKKKVNNIKMGMTKINLPKSKTTFLQNVFKAKDQTQTVAKKSNQIQQKANQLQKMIKQNIKQQKKDPQLYDDEDNEPVNSIKTHLKPFQIKKQKKQENKQEKHKQSTKPIQPKFQQVATKISIVNIKQFKKNKNTLLLQNKKKQIAQKLHAKYSEMNDDIDQKYILKIKQMKKQENSIRQINSFQLKQKFGQGKIQRRKKQLQMKLMLQYKIQLDKMKLEAERNHSKDMITLSSKYNIQQLFTQLAQCRKFVNRQKLQTQKINYITQIEQNIKMVNKMQIEKTISQIQKQCRTLMHQKITQFLNEKQKYKNNWEQQAEIAILFDNAIQKIISKHKIKQSMDKTQQSDNRLEQQNKQKGEKQNQNLLGELQSLKKKLRQLQDDNNTQRSNLSDKQAKLFDLLQNRVGPPSSR